ncbi:class IIb bacteriocin, lactobin A/cerein 7B family [Tannerella forsythia]|uniref:Class IIb bacteriocin, lactobin A/cerein 7B family n=1 Tax=Tannerella forsythia TaxID=28112 RepID=A0A1D3UHH3_TANFO|nr:class IIb bacteriocin, lactobin A/cerein 7B family [Tannerella forsythia]TPE14992.1 class IIb bacteriocin, lactobin A/cerein 7B family [Tannerella forsythia]SCQ19606.1 hypothetical protein TFUB20_00762 [Tannerella forsythia]SCQ19950.1 hypothetical protein TFUB4_01034 [Tannerella forsythia]SCQ21064.1 hypothetical protein TFUB22_01035 [Tannerella forsythia]
MKNSELTTYGVAELNAQEMEEVNGGFWGALAAAVAAYLIISSIEYPEDFVDGFLGNK